MKLYWIIFAILGLALSSCLNSASEESQVDFNIDPEYSQIFFSVSRQKYMEFDNHLGRKKCIVIANIDSTTYNPAPGGFMRGKPFKIYTLEFQQVGKDTTRLERENNMYVNYYPEKQKNSIGIKFSNLYYHGDTLPQINTDTLLINGLAINDYYVFSTSLKSNQPDDVVELYISMDKGIVAFKTLRGDFWVRQ